MTDPSSTVEDLQAFRLRARACGGGRARAPARACARAQGDART